MTYTATLTSKGQITIPKPIRDFFDLGTSDTLVFTISRNKVVAEPVKDDFMSLKGMLRVPKSLKGKSWAEIRRETKKTVARKIAEEGLPASRQGFKQ